MRIGCLKECIINPIHYNDCDFQKKVLLITGLECLECCHLLASLRQSLKEHPASYPVVTVRNITEPLKRHFFFGLPIWKTSVAKQQITERQPWLRVKKKVLIVHMRNNSEIMSRGIEETDQHFTCKQGELPGWSRCSKSKKNNNKKQQEWMWKDFQLKREICERLVWHFCREKLQTWSYWVGWGTNFCLAVFLPS